MKRSVTTLNLPKYKIQALLSKGYNYIEDLSDESVQTETGMTLNKWKSLLSAPEAKTASDLHRNDVIVTSSTKLDRILGGGIYQRLITEICGLPGSGKTQMCLQLCTNVTMPNCFGGLSAHAVYIDTNYGFSKQRFSEFASGCTRRCHTTGNYSPEFVEDSVHYLQATKFLDLIAIVSSLKKLLNEAPVKLVVVDSITHPFRGCGLENFERLRVIYSFVARLQQLAALHGFAVVVTNDFTTAFGPHGPHERPALGDSFAHRTNVRIHVRRCSDTKFSARVAKGPGAPGTAGFQITADGIRDVD